MIAIIVVRSTISAYSGTTIVFPSSFNYYNLSVDFSQVLEMSPLVIAELTWNRASGWFGNKN